MLLIKLLSPNYELTYWEFQIIAGCTNLQRFFGQSHAVRFSADSSVPNRPAELYYII